MKLFFSKLKNNKEPIWVKERCPLCNSLLFEKDNNGYKPKSVQIKCRKCKEIILVL